MDITSIGLDRAERLPAVSDRPYRAAGTFSHTAPELQGQAGFRTRLESQAEARDLWKRVFDVTLALLLIVILLPLFAIVTLLIGATSQGPIIARQVRAGRNGQLFRLYKFRTTIVGAEDVLERDLHLKDEFSKRWKLGNDPRVTPLGRWLRKTSIDELPQLINVLRGDMSLVGPRPVQPAELDVWYGELRTASSA